MRSCWIHCSPFIWEDPRGNLHALSHTFPAVGPNGGAQPSDVMSLHGFSDPDGLNWRWSAGQPYNATIFFKDGLRSPAQHATAERPKLVVNSRGTPTHLLNGLTNYMWPCNGCPGCPTSPGKPYPGCPGEHPRVCNKCKMLPVRARPSLSRARALSLMIPVCDCYSTQRFVMGVSVATLYSR
jgi:hypothetical protein